MVDKCSCKGERLGYERSGFEAWFDPGLPFSFFFIGKLSITGQKCLSVVKMVATVYERDNCDVDFNVSVDIPAIFV